MTEIDVAAHNRNAWNLEVEQGNRWTVPVSSEEIAAAREGRWEVLLTESRPVPRDWFPADLRGVHILCLASGGGQQAPILAAAGATVTVFDNSTRQLERDRFVAERDGLELVTVQGDMRDLSSFADNTFDLIFHPVSNIFVPDVRPVWHEAYRVLKPGGYLLSGIQSPIEYTFDRKLADEQGIYQIKYALPYSDLTSMTAEERREIFGEHATIEFGHSLEDQIGGQIDAGFVLTGFYESRRDDDPIANYIPSYIATKALKPDIATN
jgi:SAM-dependent methyltransferase